MKSIYFTSLNRYYRKEGIWTASVLAAGADEVRSLCDLFMQEVTKKMNQVQKAAIIPISSSPLR